MWLRGKKDMLILKGDKGKSVILNELMRNKFNECIIWDEPSVRNIEQAWTVDNIIDEMNRCDFGSLYECIMELNDSLGAGGENRDFLLIYTNKTEEEITPLIKWINNQEKYLLFKQVLVTCK